MTTQKRKTPVFFNRFPVIDPDFDNLGGELALAQIRDPGLTLAQIWNPISPGAGDPIGHPQRRIDHNRYRLRKLARRLKAAFSCKRELLQKLSRQFLLAQFKTWPKFNFAQLKCNKCVPYNGRHTINYWATGQADCW